MGLLEQIEEEVRSTDAAAATGTFGADDRFWKSGLYAFRIKGPADDAFFPLVLNPTRYFKRLPFAVDVTATQEGGIFVEKAGIVIGQLTLEGHTGFAPRRNDGETGSPRPTVPLSGQAHFLRLQNLCFGRYSEVSKDPILGPKTRMEWHNLHDDEFFIIEPDDGGLQLNRTVADRVLYRYTINAKILGTLDSAGKLPSEDRPVIKALAAATVALRGAVAEIEASITDTRGIAELREAYAKYDRVMGITTDLGTVTQDALGDVSRIAGAASEFLRGVRKTIAIPYDSIRLAQAALDRVIEAVQAAANLPADAVQILRRTDDALDRIGAYPEKFVEPFPVAAERFLALTRGPANASEADLELAAEGTITQPSQLENSASRPGDKTRVDGGVYDTRRTVPRYEGFREITVRGSDNLQRIAGRELGDARRWSDIATANDLKPPYISEEGLPGTRRAGDPLLVPTLARQGDAGTVKSKGDPAARASQFEAVLGRDLALTRTATGQYDLVVDAAGGSTDFKTVAGVANLSQAVSFILSVQRGDDVLYQQLGFERLVARKGTLDRLVESQIRIGEALRQDPRIRRIQGVRYNATGDTIEVELDAVIVDGTQSRVIGRVIS